MGDVIELKEFHHKDYSENPLTSEQGMRLLGLEKWPEHWENWKKPIFLDGLTSLIISEGEAWVRFNRESVLRELNQIMKP